MQIICKGVPHRSEKEEEFYNVALDVRGKARLEASMDFYVQGELMEGDNAYFCEDIDRKVGPAPGCHRGCRRSCWERC